MIAEELQAANPREVSPLSYRSAFTAFLLEKQPQSVERLLLEPPQSTFGERRDAHHALHVDCRELAHFDPKLSYLLLHNPALLLPLFDEAAVVAQQKAAKSERLVAEARRRFESGDADRDASAHWLGAKAPSTDGEVRDFLENSVKALVHVRLFGLPPVFDHEKSGIGSLRSSDAGKLVQLRGTIVRTSKLRLLEHSKTFECGKCGESFTVYADLEQGGRLCVPERCPNKEFVPRGNQAARPGPCGSTSLSEREAEREVADYQEARLQDRANLLNVGSIPRSIGVVLLHDLVDSVKPGDDVVLVGRLLRRWRAERVHMRCDVEHVILCQSAIVSGGEDASRRSGVPPELERDFLRFWAAHGGSPLRARDHIASAVCPQIYGMRAVKLALLLTICGGVGRRPERADGDEGGEMHERADGGERSGGGNEAARERHRGQPHLLIVGDPGTGKSQFPRFCTRLSSRAVLTTGVGTTSAGLTCSAVRDGGEWQLEAGAMVLADRGLCCIDEFSSIRPHDRQAIHEAMEQQTLSVAKAGMVCTLNARAAVVAVTNPRGGVWDASASAAVNTALEAPLLSRFDLVLLLRDPGDAKWDAKVSGFVLAGAISGVEAGTLQQLNAATSKRRRLCVAPGAASAAGAAGAATGVIDGEAPWSAAKLQAYLCFVKRFRPSLSRDAARVINAYYLVQRREAEREIAGGGDGARPTLRALESIVRLAQAHARLCCRSEATVQDAVEACVLTEMSVASANVLDAMKVGSDLAELLDIHGGFAEQPDSLHAAVKGALLEHLGIGPAAAEPSPYEGVAHFGGAAGGGSGEEEDAWAALDEATRAAEEEWERAQQGGDVEWQQQQQQQQQQHIDADPWAELDAVTSEQLERHARQAGHEGQQPAPAPAPAPSGEGAVYANSQGTWLSEAAPRELRPTPWECAPAAGRGKENSGAGPKPFAPNGGAVDGLFLDADFE